MNEIKSITGKVELNENSNILFENIIISDFDILANSSDITFLDCFFYNDLRIIGGRNVKFVNCTFTLDSEVKKNSININSENINIENVYVNDTEKGDSVVRFNCDKLDVNNFCYLTNKNNNSVLDVNSYDYSFENCNITARKNFYEKLSVKSRVLKKD